MKIDAVSAGDRCATNCGLRALLTDLIDPMLGIKLQFECGDRRAKAFHSGAFGWTFKDYGPRTPASRVRRSQADEEHDEKDRLCPHVHRCPVGWRRCCPRRLGSHQAVTINGSEFSGVAEASVAGARNSANNVEWFHCSAYDGYASCYFRDANTQGEYCYTVDTYHVEAIKTVGAASYVKVEWRDSLGHYCRDVTVENGSEYVN